MNIDGRLAILLVALFVAIFSYWQPYQRGFNCSDDSIKQTFQIIWFSTKYLFFVTLILPLLIIFLVEKHTESVSCSANMKKFLLGFMIILNITEMVKRTVGRLRPHTYDLCNLDHYCQDGSTDKYIPRFQCENDDYPWLVVNARLSFFSGHSALGSFVGTYLIMFIHQRYMCKTKPTTTTTTTTKTTPTTFRQKCLWYTMLATIFLLYLIPGYTQWLINWHFLTDILTGFSIGTLCAWLVFKLINVQ